MLARTINASWNQANNKTFGPGHIYRYQIRILHIKHFYPQLTDKNGNQMENVHWESQSWFINPGWLGWDGFCWKCDCFRLVLTKTIWPGVGIWWKAFLWNCGVGPDSTLHWRIMRALPPVSCINYNRPGCSATRWSTVCFCEVQCSTVQPIEQYSLCSAVLFSVVLCCAVCLCLASITAGAGAPLWYILRLTHIQPQHANSYIYAFPCTRVNMCGVQYTYTDIHVWRETHLAKSYIYSFSLPPINTNTIISQHW